MMKKLLAAAVVFTLAMCMLASCAAPSVSPEEKAMMKKLRQIKSDWTEQQVRELLGEPDRFGERSVVAEIFYTVSPTKEAAIAFWSEGIEITVTDSETGEKTGVLNVPIMDVSG